MPGNWIQKMDLKKGALRRQLGVKGDKDIPAKKLKKAAKAGGLLGRRARLAESFSKMRKR